MTTTYIVLEVAKLNDHENYLNYYGSCSSGSSFGFNESNAKEFKTRAGAERAIKKHEVANAEYTIIPVSK